MDYFRKLEKTLVVTGNDDLVKYYQHHLNEFLNYCNKKPFEVTLDDIKGFIACNDGNRKIVSSLGFFYFVVLKK